MTRMNPPIDNSLRHPSSSSTISINDNPWRSSYHHGGSVIDPSGLTSYSSSTIPSSSSHESPSHLEPNQYSQNLENPNGIDSHLNQPLVPPRQTYMNSEAYETTLGWRVDILAGMTYFTPLMAFILLIFETKNDFIRIHAYQSLLLAIPIIILHFLFLSFQSLQTLFFIMDIGAYAWLGYQAYGSADTLERNLLPIIGPIAEEWTLEE